LAGYDVVVVTGTVTRSNISTTPKIHVYQLNRAEHFLFQAKLNFRRGSNCGVFKPVYKTLCIYGEETSVWVTKLCLPRNSIWRKSIDRALVHEDRFYFPSTLVRSIHAHISEPADKANVSHLTSELITP